MTHGHHVVVTVLLMGILHQGIYAFVLVWLFPMKVRTPLFCYVFLSDATTTKSCDFDKLVDRSESMDLLLLLLRDRKPFLTFFPSTTVPSQVLLQPVPTGSDRIGVGSDRIGGRNSACGIFSTPVGRR